MMMMTTKNTESNQRRKIQNPTNDESKGRRRYLVIINILSLTEKETEKIHLFFYLTTQCTFVETIFFHQN